MLRLTVFFLIFISRLTTTPEQALNLNPAISDDGRVVVFETSANLFAGGMSGSFHGIRAEVSTGAFLNLGATRIVSPAVSGDGRVIAFASTEDLVGTNADRNSEIFVFSGGVLKQITHTEARSALTRLEDGNFQPSISSDGQLIVFSSFQNIVLFDGDFSLLSDGVNPRISGDGSRVYFRRGSDLVLLDLRTRTSRAVATELPKLAIGNGRGVSNDGMRFVFASETAPNQSQVFLYDARENNVRQLTQLGARVTDVNLQPTISDDGKRVAFATRRKVVNTSDGSVELYVYDIPTGQTQQITNAPSAATAEVVSSLNFDGSVIAFNFPRLLSGAVADEDLRNNSEIYVATVPARPAFGVATVLNAAALGNEAEQKIAPGSIATIRGGALAFKTEMKISTDENRILTQPPLVLAGSTVSVNGRAARIFYASPEEIVFIVPDGLAAGAAEFVVTNSDGFSSKAQAIISATAPGVFTVSADGEGEAIALDADTQTAAPFDPTSGRARIAIFATGVAHATNVSITINRQVVATINGVVATVNGQVLAAESITPSGLPGLDEIHVLLPPELRGAGTSTLVVNADGIRSNTVSLTIGGSSPPSSRSKVVISQIFGGGGNSGAPFRNDFIEIFNSGDSPINLANWSVQYASATASTWSVTPLTAITLAPGQYYLIQQAGGSNGVALPAPDATGTIAMAATAGKVALVKTTTALSGACPADPNIVDLAGYGSTANCFNGAGPTPAPSNTNAVLRKLNGCTDTRNNSADFAAGKPDPRNIASPVNICADRVAVADIFRFIHALSHRRGDIAARAFWLRQLPRRPT
jgi:uncharacterized protein (TIGR03437 family)